MRQSLVAAIISACVRAGMGSSYIRMRASPPQLKRNQPTENSQASTVIPPNNGGAEGYLPMYVCRSHLANSLNSWDMAQWCIAESLPSGGSRKAAKVPGRCLC